MRILIAEDDPLVALALASRLAELGHEVDGPYRDGSAALEASFAAPPDAYVLDIGLPVLDGLALAGALSERGLRRPVVIVTGNSDASLVDEAARVGVGAYLLKPIDARALDAALRLSAARYDELVAAEHKAERAAIALEERKLVERAKDLLAQSLGVPEAEAYRRLQRSARERNLRLPDVARALLEHQAVLAGSAARPGAERGRPAR